jgi:hypothetical protein
MPSVLLGSYLKDNSRFSSRLLQRVGACPPRSRKRSRNRGGAAATRASAIEPPRMAHHGGEMMATTAMPSPQPAALLRPPPPQPAALLLRPPSPQPCRPPPPPSSSAPLSRLPCATRVGRVAPKRGAATRDSATRLKPATQRLGPRPATRQAQSRGSSTGPVTSWPPRPAARRRRHPRP